MPYASVARRTGPAEPVARTPSRSTVARSRPPRASASCIPAVVQRCGGHRCPEGTCNHTDEIGDVVSSPGRPLDASARQLMETQLGAPFDAVRIHTDARAQTSATSVGAVAYTVGSHVVFGPGAYQPGDDAGQRLLAHELTHVMQQGGGAPGDRVGIPGELRLGDPADAFEQEAEAAAAGFPRAPSGGTRARPSAVPVGRVQRLVGRLDCTANVAGATADPRPDVTDADTQAQAMAAQLGTDFAADATAAAGGIPASPSPSFQSYIDHFGLPPASGAGFMNRITGTVVATQPQAASEELRILSRRFALVARFFGDRIHYACGAGVVDLGGGCRDDCAANNGDAFTCRGSSGIALCPTFWTSFTDPTARGAVLIHETFHIIWGPTNPRDVGQVGDETLRGPGRNFDVAGCYEFLVDDVFGTDSGASCPAIP